MEENYSLIRNTGIKYGLICTAGFIVYFLIMRALGLAQITNYRFFNYAILAAIVYFGLSEHTHKIGKHRLSYLPGLFTGMLICFVTAVCFGLFMLIYSGKIDHEFLRSTQDNMPIEGIVNPYILAIAVASEIMVLGMIISFVFMQLFKRNRSEDEEALDEAEERGTSYNPATGKE